MEHKSCSCAAGRQAYEIIVRNEMQKNFSFLCKKTPGLPRPA